MGVGVSSAFRVQYYILYFRDNIFSHQFREKEHEKTKKNAEIHRNIVEA